MANNKKVFCGALFDLHVTACNEIIDRFKESLGDDGAPFVSYDKVNKAFTFMVDRQDDTVTSVFAVYLKTYIDGQAESGPDPYQSPKICPFDGTVLQDPLFDEVQICDGNEGLLAISNDNDSSDEADAHETPSHIRTYWSPQQGKISVITAELVTLLAQSTGCSFFPDHCANRVGISGVNFNQALHKLQNLESLQMLVACQPSEESSKAVANVLMLAKVENNIVIQFLPLIRGTRAYDRIIVREQSQIDLDGKCVGELRYAESHNRTDQLIPPHLQNLSGSTENRPSRIWTDITALPREKRRSMEPVRLSKSPSETTSALHAPTSSAGGTLASLLPPIETRQIESWAESIDATANPNEIAVEPPKDLTQDTTRIGRQRRVATAESESESENDQVTSVGTVPKGDPNGGGEDDSGAGSDVASPTTMKSQQQRLKPEDFASEKHEPTPAANSPRNIGRRRRVKTVDSSDDELSSAVTEATTEPGQTSSRALKEGSVKISIPSPCGSLETCAVPSMPASFDRNAWVGRGSSPGGKRRRRGGGGGGGGGTRLQRRERNIGVLIPTRGGTSHSKNRAENGRGGRPTTKQGTRTPGRKFGNTQNRTGSCGDQNLSFHPVRDGQQPHRSHPTQQERSRGGGFNPGRGNAGGISHSYSTNYNLVDIVPTIITGQIKPPPGFDMRFESPEEVSLQSPNLIDEPLYLQGLSLPPTTSPRITLPENPPVAASRSSPTSSISGQFYVNTFNPGPNVAAMQDEQLQMLLAQRHELAGPDREQVWDSQMGVSTDTTSLVPALSPTEYSLASWSHATLRVEDEVSTRQFRRTMSQGVANPGKKGKSQKTEETKKQREARIAKAKADAHGEIPIAKRPEQPSPKFGLSTDEVDKGISAKKRQELKNSHLAAEADPVAAEDVLRRSQKTNLVDSLKPLFEAGRAFSGKLRFEIQFGQVISAFPSKGGKHHFIDLQEWHRRFHPRLGMLAEVTSFTNVLTTNGADADRMLDMKTPSPGSITVWSSIEPIPREVSYEFQCQTKDNNEFWLVVNQNGTSEMRRSPTTVGMVNLHFPGQVWDACAVVDGVMNHPFAEPVKEAANAFVSSLYIPQGTKEVSITYRLPATNEMTVRNLFMKRKSLHNCNVIGRHDFQLQITEVQTLYHQFHKGDKKLGQGFVKDFSQMVNDGRLYYEVSLMHKGISKLLEQNAGLELGELTDAWTETEILSSDRMRSMIDLTTLVVSKIDGIGSKNIGSLFRKDVERLIEETHFTLEPAASPVHRAATSGMNLDVASHVQGVRGGRPDIVWDNGQAYAVGFGGAWVPVMNGRGRGSDEVVPDDSASQAKGPAGTQVAIRTGHPAQAANISTGAQRSTAHGFW